MLKLLKFVTGEEVLSEVSIEPGKSKYKLEDSVCIQPVADKDGNMQLQFLPWTTAMFAKDNVVVVDVAHVLAEADPADEIKQRHSEIFGRVFVPEKKLILT